MLPHIFSWPFILVLEFWLLWEKAVCRSAPRNICFAVDAVSDGASAVEKLKGSDGTMYDLILMDIQMPVMNGYEAAKQIRSLKNRETASVPIVAMTANAVEEDREKSYEAGMNGYLAKPVSAEALINTIDKIMKDN